MEYSPKEITEILKASLDPSEWNRYVAAIGELTKEAQDLERWFNDRLGELMKEKMLERFDAKKDTMH